MCRYLARPPPATGRLTETGVGDELHYELKKAWRDGTRFLLLDPYELILRLCTMVPPPWFHMVRFHGVFVPIATLREQVAASARLYGSPSEITAPNPVQMTRFCGRCQWLSDVRWANELAPGCIDCRCDSRGFATGGFGRARPTTAKESAAGTALVAVSEDASQVKCAASCVVALAVASAYAHVRPRVQKTQGAREATSPSVPGLRLHACACTNTMAAHKTAQTRQLRMCHLVGTRPSARFEHIRYSFCAILRDKPSGFSSNAGGGFACGALVKH